MSSTDRCIYPTLETLTDTEISAYFTPTSPELSFCQQHCRQVSQKACFLILLKTTAYLNYVPTLNQVPYKVIRHVNEAISYRRLTKSTLLKYAQSGAKTRHLAQIRRYLNLKPVNAETESFMYQSALSIAQTKSHLTDIVNATIEYLTRNHYELPKIGALQKCARKARANANNELYDRICSELTQAQQASLDYLLNTPQNQSHSSDWNRLKASPKKPTPLNIKEYLKHLTWLESIADGIEIPSDLAAAKLEQLENEARSLHVAQMWQLKKTKRYSLMTVLIHAQRATALDNVIDIFIKVVQDIENQGKRKMQAYYLLEKSKSDKLVTDFQSVLESLEVAETDSQTLAAVQEQIKPHLNQWLLECDQYLASSDKKHAPFMIKAYKNRRNILFTCLNAITLHARVNDQALLKSWNLIQQNKDNSTQYLNLKKKNSQRKQLNLNWVPKLWQIMLSTKGRSFSETDRFRKEYFELCVFCQIKSELQCGDLTIEGGREYGDYTAQFVDDATLANELRDYGDLVQLPIQGQAFVNRLKTELSNLILKVDRNFPDIEEAWFDNGILKLKQVRASPRNKSHDTLDAHIKRSLGRVSILEVITDTVNWLQLDQYFKPLSELEGKIADPKERLISTLFCYGCNIGPSQTAECLKGISRKQIAWLNLRYASESNLTKAINRVINTYQKMEITQYWGDGRSVSADGTHRQTYEDNLMSRFHIRYRKKGRICYFLTSNSYICLFSHFIPCGVHESNFILDGITSNETDMEPDQIHGDTHAQTLATFGLSYLLGIDLMPRIRKIKKLKLYKVDDSMKLKHIGRLFKESVNWDLIAQYLPEMYRVALSVKKGILTPSAILRRMGVKNRKNRLFFAFQELGKVIRTMFLLRYISDYELRRFIQRETNKSEQFNNFAQWVSFFNGGLIADNQKHEQDKIVKYQHLLANLVVLYNAEKMTRALKKIKAEGFDLQPEHMRHLSPYWTSHINRLGEYRMNLKRGTLPIDYKLGLF